MKVLVTGGAGYIGSHACKALAAAGHIPVVYDNLVHGHRWAVRWGPLEEGDIADRDRLDAVIKHWRPEAVMHFAAYAYVGESVTDPGKYYRNNVVGTLTLLEAMRDHAIDRLVFSSSCATYGEPKQLPMSESHPQSPINPYGASKLMIERMLADFAHAHSLRAISLRYFNAAGADPEGELGEAHSPETHLIPLLLEAALGLRPALNLYGDDYPTADGSCIRDYVHVSDLAQAHCLALGALADGAAGMRAYNIGTGRGHSVKQVIEAAARVTGQKIAIRALPRRAGDPPALVADATRIQAELGWRATRSDLDSIIGSAWCWMRSTQDSTLSGKVRA